MRRLLGAFVAVGLLAVYGFYWLNDKTPWKKEKSS